MALKITIGADPELFLRNKDTGKIVSAHDLMPGTKENPFEVNNGAIQVDGVAAEFNILPATSAQYFSDYIASVMSQLQEKVGNGYELVIEPTALFDENYFKSLPEFNRELGCIPDWNGWTGQLNQKPDGLTYQRAAGGHIHVGWGKGMDVDDPMHIQDCAKVARQMDYYVGMYSLFWDRDKERRNMYGKAGCFRPKPYGMEYRTPSNAWLKTPKLQQWVFNASHKAFNDLVSGGCTVEDTLKDACVDIINNSEEWWTGKIKLSSLTGLRAPPIVPKLPPGKKAVSQADIMKALDSMYSMSPQLQAAYVEAAEEGNTEAILKCNTAIGSEYFQSLS